MMKKKLGLLFGLLSLLSFSAFTAKLLNNDQHFVNQQLLFKPKFELAVSDQITEAINNGITITFVVQAKLQQTVDWWFDSTISSKLYTFKLHYYSMSRIYLLHNITTDSSQNFVTLDQLLEQLSQETEFSFDMAQGGDYIETRIFLDKQALPSTMQLPTVFDQDWNINSDWQIVAIKQPVSATDE
ncbi:MAG: DUF4390 domain-containing protein [Marinicella sp.]